MGTSVPQVSFASGEIAPALYGRVDFQGYQNGLRTCRNFIVQKFGGVQNRPGLRFIAEANDSTSAVRLIPFIFSNEQSYVLEFGDRTMRVIRNGAPITVNSSPLVVATTWGQADLYLLKFVQSNDVLTVCHPSYPPQQIGRYADDDWRISPFLNVNGPFLDLGVDDSKLMSANGITGSVTITASFDAFDSANHVGRLLKLQQSPDSTTPTWEVAKSVIVNDILRAGSNYYQAVNTGITGTVLPDHQDGVRSDGVPGVSWKYLHSGFGIVLITGVIDARHASATVLQRLPDLITTSSQARAITSVMSGTEMVPAGEGNPELPATPSVIIAPAHGVISGSTITVTGVLGAIQVNGVHQAAVVDANTLTLNDVNVTAEYEGGGYLTATVVGAQPTHSWAFEAWGGEEGYPGTTGFYQQRQCFAGMTGHPGTLEMSRTAGYTDFGSNVPILDDDAITVAIFSNKAVEVRHLLELSSLLVLTSAGVFVMKGGGNGDGMLTPATVQVKPQGANASAHVPPLKVNHFGLFVQEKGSQVRSLAYSFSEDSFVGNDLTVISNHLFAGHKIIDWCYQEFPNSCVWAIRDDGVLLGLTFVPEQQITAWHRHDTDGVFESCCCIPEEGEDAVYFVVRRTVGGQQKRYIERMDGRGWSRLQDAFFVDSGLSYSGSAATRFGGLQHLEGRTVSILADGYVHPQQVVTDGEVILEYPASTVHVGLPITADFETLDIGQAVLLEKKKSINQVSLLVLESSHILAGPDPAHLHEYKQRTFEDYSQPVAMTSEMINVAVQTTWTKSARVFIRQDYPLPISILAVIPDVKVGGSG